MNKMTENKSFQQKLEKFDINQRSVIMTIMLIAFVDVLGYTLILPVLPSIQTAFDIDYALIGIIIASNAIAAMVFSPIWGRLSDKYGRKPMLLLSQGGTLISFLILAISPSIEIILFSRILDGIFGGQIPIIRALITDVTDEKNRGSIMGKLMSAFIFGMIIGPVLGGFLGTIDWRLTAMSGVIFSFISILLTLFLLIETMPRERIKALNEMRERQLKVKGQKERLLTNTFVSLLLIFFLIDFAHNNYSISIIFILNELGFNVIFTGVLLMFTGLIFFIVSSYCYQPLYNRIGEKKLTILGFGLVIISFLFYPFLSEAWMFFAFVIPFVFGLALLMPTFQMKISFAAPETRQGEAAGYLTNIQSITAIIAPILVTTYLGMQNYQYLMIGLTTIIILGIALIISLIGYKNKEEKVSPMEAMMKIGEILKKKGVSEEEMMDLMGNLGGTSMISILKKLGDIESISKEDVLRIMKGLGGKINDK